MRFPVISGHNLEGQAYTLPRDLAGQQNVVILAFEQWHQTLVDGWMPDLARLAAQHPGLRYYEIPTLAQYGWLQRWMIDGGMRAGIPDPAVRARTITVYLDRRPLLAALDIPDTRAIHTLLLDRQGMVRWRASGAAHPDKIAALEHALAVQWV